MFFLRLNSSLQASQNTIFTDKHSSGNSLTLSIAPTDFGSLEPGLLANRWITGNFSLSCQL